MGHTVEDNLILASLPNLTQGGSLLNRKASGRLAKEWISTMDIRVPTKEAPVKELSGGNQQKTVLARWMATDPDLLILDKPTVGIDVATRNPIHQLMQILAARGMSILLMSDDPQELVHNAHRILLMERGRIAGEYLRGTINAETLRSTIQEL